jgi:hypothetical protein
MDSVYLGLDVNHFHIDRGTLSLLAEPASERVKSTVEAPIKISTVPGTWPGRLSDEIDVTELLGGGPTRQRKSDHGRVDRQKRDQSKTLDKSIWVLILPPTVYSGWPIPSHTTSIVSKWGVPKPGQSCRNATESPGIEHSHLPAGIAIGASLPPRIVAKDIGSVSYRAGHAPTQHLLVSGLSATSAMLASKTQ